MSCTLSVKNPDYSALCAICSVRRYKLSPELSRLGQYRTVLQKPVLLEIKEWYDEIQKSASSGMREFRYDLQKAVFCGTQKHNGALQSFTNMIRQEHHTDMQKSRPAHIRKESVKNLDNNTCVKVEEIRGITEVLADKNCDKTLVLKPSSLPYRIRL